MHIAVFPIRDLYCLSICSAVEVTVGYSAVPLKGPPVRVLGIQGAASLQDVIVISPIDLEKLRDASTSLPLISLAVLV